LARDAEVVIEQAAGDFFELLVADDFRIFRSDFVAHTRWWSGDGEFGTSDAGLGQQVASDSQKEPFFNAVLRRASLTAFRETMISFDMLLYAGSPAWDAFIGICIDIQQVMCQA
jgi:hypothetical protein